MSQAAWAEELIESVALERPDVVRLAEWASLAVQVDAPLLRRLRRGLLPESHPGLEADLWFSPLLEAQDEEAGAFHEAVLLRLRERVRERLRAPGEPPFNRVARLVRAAHAHLPAAARLEENLTALAVRATTQDGSRMERALEPALRALAGTDEAHALEIARWAMQAAGRLPESVRTLPLMQVLLLAASLRLEQPALADAAGQAALPVEALSWLVPAALPGTPTTLGVELLADGVRFTSAEQAKLSIALPPTNPLLVSLRWRGTDAERYRLVRVAPGITIEIPGGAESITIVTLAGDAYTLARATLGAQVQQATAAQPSVDPRDTLWDLRLQEPLRTLLEKSFAAFGMRLSDAMVRDPLAGTDRAYTAAEGGGLRVALLQVPPWIAGDIRNVVSLDPIGASFNGANVRLLSQGLEAGALALMQVFSNWKERHGIEARFVPWTYVKELEQGKVALGQALGLDLPGDAGAIPREFLDGCVQVEDLGSLRTPSVAFPAGAGLWLGSAKALGSVPIVGTVGGDTHDQFEVLNATDDAASVRILRPVLPNRRGQALPLSASLLADEQRPCWAVAFIEQKARPIRVRLRQGDSPSDSQLLVGVPPVELRCAGAPVIQGDAVVAMVTVGESRGTTKDGSFLLDIALAADIKATLAAMPGVLDEQEAGPPPPPGAVTCVQFFRSNRNVLVGMGDGYVRLYEEQSSALITDFRAHNGAVLSFALARGSEELVVSGGSDGTLTIWNLDGDYPTMTRDFKSSVLGVAATGESALAGCADGTLRVFALHDSERQKWSKAHVGGVRALSVLGTDDRAVTGGSDGTVVIWDLKELRQLRSLRGELGHQSTVTALAATPDGQLVVSGSADRTLRVWEVSTGRLLGAMSGHEDAVCAVAVTPDGRRVLSGSMDGTLRLWPRPETTGVSTLLSRHEAAVRSVAVSDDGQLVVAGSEDGMVRIWNLDSGSLVREFHSGPHRVFLNYEPRLAPRVARLLGLRGLAPHLSRGTTPPGETLPANAARAIGESELLLAFVTPDVELRRLAAELSHAVARRVRVLPVRFGRTQPLESLLPRDLVSVRTHALKTDDDSELARLADRVENLLRQPNVSNADEPQPKEPERPVPSQPRHKPPGR